MRFLFHSSLQSLSHCYAKVIKDTCSESSADINVLMSVLYDAKLSNVIDKTCVLGELRLFADLAQYKRIRGNDILTSDQKCVLRCHLSRST